MTVLCVDLDGTLIKTDSLIESTLLALKKKPLLVFVFIFWMLRGKSYYKHKITSIAIPDPAFLPYNEDVLSFIKNQKLKGKQIVLTTASVRSVAESVADYLDVFDDIIPSEGDTNNKGKQKRDTLTEKYGNNWDYIGDSKADLPVWEAARKAYAVDPSNKFEKKIRQSANLEFTFNSNNHYLRSFIKEIRVYQWLKNLLIFLPFLMAHQFSDNNLYYKAFFAFLTFSLSASFVYVINDLLDLESDRHHPRKKFRPFASGELPFMPAFSVSLILFIAGIVCASILLPQKFLIVLISYIISTTLYSFYLKRIYIVDIILLSVLYTIRLIAGSAALDVPLSKWLMTFSVFFFLSLAIVKRYTELMVMKKEKKDKTRGRGYIVDDLQILLSIGTASGYLSCLVFVLYLFSPEVTKLYQNSEYLFPVALLILFWITRIWFMAHRDQMHDDPIVFTSKDKVSYFIGFLIILCVIGAILL